MIASRNRLPMPGPRSERDGDFFAQLSRECAHYPVLSAAEERALVAQMQSGSKQAAQDARQTLALHNLRLVMHVAKKYMNRHIAFAELINAGTEGLMIGLDHFEARGEQRLSTYLVPVISHACYDAVLRAEQVVRLPQPVVTLRKRAARFLNTYAIEHGREPTLAETAQALGVSYASLDTALHAQYNAISLESLNAWDNTAGDDDATPYADRLPDHAPAVEEVALDNVERGDLYDCLRRILTPRELVVMAYRYRLGSLAYEYCEDEMLARDEVALRLGVSRETVRTLEASALAKLRQAYGVTVEQALSATMKRTVA